MRLCFGMIDTAMPGGIPAAEIPFQEACVELGHDVRLLPFGRRSTQETLLRSLVTRVGDWLSYARRIQSERPDVVHLNSAYDRRALLRDTGYVALSRLFGQPLFLKLHGSDRGLIRSRNPLWRWVGRFVIGQADLVGLLSTEELAEFAAAGFPSERLLVVKNAAEVERFNGPSIEARAENCLLFIGRLDHKKGGRELLEAMARLRRAGRVVELDIVGDGAARRELEELAGRLDLGSAVRFHGHVPEKDTVRFYRRATMLVLPSYHEGLSMTLLHGAAAGLAIVATRVGGAADLLREPENCLWVSPRDPEGLAERIGRLLADPVARATMGDANRKLVARYAPRSVAEEYLVHYRRIARGSSDREAAR